MCQVEEMWNQRQERKLEQPSDHEDSSDEDIFEDVDECIVKVC